MKRWKAFKGLSLSTLSQPTGQRYWMRHIKEDIMGKIYGNDGAKLTNAQVLEKIKTLATIGDKEVIRGALNAQIEVKSSRKRLSHAILDCYKSFTGIDDATVEMKRCLKFIMEKYMKSSVQDSEAPYEEFIAWINTDVVE